MMIEGPSFYEGMRIEPKDYIIPGTLMDERVSFDRLKNGSELKVSFTNKEVLEIVSSSKEDDSYHSNSNNIKLKAKDGILKDLDVWTSMGDNRGSVIHLNLEGENYEEKFGLSNGIMLQRDSKADTSNETKFDVEVKDEKERNWHIIQPDAFSKNDLKGALERTVDDVDQLLMNLTFANSPSMAQNINKILTQFGDDSLNAYDMYESSMKNA